MCVYLLIITVLTNMPFATIEDEMRDTRCWCVPNAHEAAILIYQQCRKFEKDGTKIKCQLWYVDLKDKTAEEMEIPTIKFEFKKKPL